MENQTLKNPLKSILNISISIFILLFLSYIGLRIAITYDIDYKRIDLLKNISDEIKILGLSVFNFVRPFLQLVIILIILEWILLKFGLSVNKNSLKFDSNVQTAIALIVIVSFSLASLSGVDGAGDLKDIALVVVGFYFGTQRKTNEVIEGESKITSIEEHTNDKG